MNESIAHGSVLSSEVKRFVGLGEWVLSHTVFSSLNLYIKMDFKEVCKTPMTLAVILTTSCRLRVSHTAAAVLQERANS